MGLIKFLLSELLKFERKTQNINNKIVKSLGGLYVIGTERNNSRRIDNQLRGRCGRQGDPGRSRFFLSLEDSLFKNFGSSQLQNFMQSGLLDDLPLEASFLTASLDGAQKRIEEKEYERRKLLESRSVREALLAYGEQVINDIIDLLKDPKLTENNCTVSELFKLKIGDLKTLLGSFDQMELKTYLFQEFWLSYEAKIVEFEICQSGLIKSFERTVLLYYTDSIWKEHLQKLHYYVKLSGGEVMDNVTHCLNLQKRLILCSRI